MNLYDPFNLLRTKKESTGKPPGTLSYSGNYSDVELQIEVLTYDATHYEFKSIKHAEDLEQVLSKVYKDETVCWINIIGLHNQDLIRTVGNALGVHHMDLEDVVHVSQWSKILNQNDYLFSIFKMIYLDLDQIKHEHVSVVVKDGFVITFQETPGDVFSHIRNRLSNPSGQLRTRQANFLYYSLLDAIVDEYIVVVNHISQRFNDIEMQIIEDKSPNKEELYGLRKELLYFSNSLSPLIDAVRRFANENNPFYTKDMKPYYDDLNDHLNQVLDSIKAYREMSNSLHEMQMSNASMRMNRTMMTLTIFSAIFIPLSFLAGVFGMNFTSVPGLNNPMSFQMFALFCMALAGSMIVYFKLKKW